MVATLQGCGYQDPDLMATLGGTGCAWHMKYGEGRLIDRVDSNMGRGLGDYCWKLTVIGGAKTDGMPLARQLNVTSRGSVVSVVVKPFAAGGLPMPLATPKEEKYAPVITP